MEMHWLSYILGVLTFVPVVFVAWVLHTVVGGLTRQGEHQARWAELWRQWMGQQLEAAAVRYEARRLNAIDKERQRLNEQEAARAQQ